MNIIIREAKVADIPAIQKLIKHYVQQRRVLGRSLGELYETTRDFLVAQTPSGEIVGCCALHIVWEDLAEIKSLMVNENLHRQGIGSQLITQALKLAKNLGVKRVFALTYEIEFFNHKGFVKIDKATLPHKVWSECIRCVHFPDCDEIAMICEL